MEVVCDSCCESTKAVVNACDCNFKSCKQCASKIGAITCCSCDGFLEADFVFRYFTYPKIIEFKKKYLKTAYVPDSTVLTYHQNKMRMSTYTQACPIAECEGHIVHTQCDVCSIKICPSCGDVLDNDDSSPHVCAPEPVASIDYIRDNTKKCPKCRVPIEKNKGCTHMTCANCNADFSWVSMELITKLGLQNEEVFNGFYLQLAKDLKIRGFKNRPLERALSAEAPKITRQFADLLCQFHSGMHCTSQDIETLFEVFYRRAYILKAMKLLSTPDKLYQFLSKPKLVSMPSLCTMIDENNQIVLSQKVVQVVRLFAHPGYRIPQKTDYLPQQWAMFFDLSVCEYLANKRDYKHFITWYSLSFLTKGDTFVYKQGLEQKLNFYTKNGINPIYQPLVATGEKIAVEIMDTDNWRPLPSNVFCFLGLKSTQTLYKKRLENLLDTEDEWGVIDNFVVDPKLKKSELWTRFRDGVRDYTETIIEKNDMLTLRFFNKLKFYAFLTLPQARF